MSSLSRRLPNEGARQSFGRREAALIFVALAFLVVAWLTAAFPALAAARDTVLAIVGLLFLVVPGFVVAEILRNETQNPDLVSLLSAATVGLGFISLGGLALDLLPWGITGTSWLGLIGVLIASASVLRPRMARSRARPVPDAEVGEEAAAAPPSRLVPVGLLIASAVAVSLVALGNGQPTPGALAVWFCAVCPGIAVHRLIGEPTRPASLLLALGTSVAISAGVGAVLLLVGVFTVALLLQVVTGLTVAALIADPWLYERQWEPSIDRMGIDSVIVLLAALLVTLIGYAYPFLMPATSVAVLALAVAALALWLETGSGGSVTLAVALGAAALPGMLTGIGFSNVGEIAVVVTGYAFIAVATIRYFRGGGLGSQLWLGVLALLFAVATTLLGGSAQIPAIAAAAVPLIVGLGVAVLPMADRPTTTADPPEGA
jgi:hypothetical protein